MQFGVLSRFGGGSLASAKVRGLSRDSGLQTDQFSSQARWPQSRAVACAECGLAKSRPAEKEVIPLARDAAPKPVLSFGINGTAPRLPMMPWRAIPLTRDAGFSTDLVNFGGGHVFFY